MGFCMHVSSHSTTGGAVTPTSPIHQPITLINTKFLTVSPNAPLNEVVALMGSDRETTRAEATLTSCVFVVETGELVGIITAWNIVQLIAQETPLESVTARDCMTHPVISIAEAEIENLRQTPSLLYQQQMRHLPVVNAQGALVGVITPTSIQQVLQPSNFPKLQRVGNIMTTHYAQIPASAAIVDLARLIIAQQLDVVMVVPDQTDCVDGGASGGSAANDGDSPSSVLMGIITPQDIIRFQASKLNSYYSNVQAVMHPFKNYLNPTDSLWFAHQEMHQHQVSCLPILDHRGVLLGVVSDMDVLRACDPTELYRSSGQVQRSMQQLKYGRMHVLQHRAAELERLVRERTAQLEEQAMGDRLLAAMTLRIHQSLDLSDILTTTATEIRQTLHADRVVICQLDSPQRGTIVAESIEDTAVPGWSTMLHSRIPNLHLATDWLNAYRNGHVQVITNIRAAGLESQHIEEFIQFQVQAVLAVPILLKGNMTQSMTKSNATDDPEFPSQRSLPPHLPISSCSDSDLHLWGLLVVHHCAHPRCWQQWEISLLEQLTKQVGIAIHRSQLHQQVQAELQERRRVEAELAHLLSNLEQTVQERTASWQEVADRLILEIAERKWAEEQLQQTTDQLRAVLDTVPGLVSWVSADLHYLGVNQRLADTFNLPPSEFIGQPVGFLQKGFRLREFLEDFFAQASPTIIQEINTNIDAVPHSYLIAAQKYNQGQAAVVVGIDITAHKRAGKALQDSEAKFRDIVEQTNDWVWEIDRDLRFTYVNPRVRDIIGYTPQEILGRSLLDFMLTDEAVRLRTVLDYHIHQQEAFSQLETTLLHQAGNPIVLEISGTPVFAPQGTLQGYRGITRDITERKQVELNIRRALTKEKELNELKNRFISMASHEFRTPLTAILASAESLERYQARWTESKRQAVLQRIQAAAKHMTGLLNDVLLVGKADAGKLECKPSILNLEEFCTDLLDEVCINSIDNCRVHFTSTGDCTRLWLDEKLLRPILTNLLSNALKYSPPDATVQFVLNRETDHVVLAVTDQGIGIPLEDQKRLFESFHRAANVGNIPGTGLGLTIVKNAVKAHGGKVMVSSQVGAGTTFTVSIPLIKGDCNNEKNSCD